MRRRRCPRHQCSPDAWELPATPNCMLCALWAGVGVYLGAVPLWSTCLSVCLSVFVSSGGGGRGQVCPPGCQGFGTHSSFTSLLQQQAQGPAPAVLLGSSGPAAADGAPTGHLCLLTPRHRGQHLTPQTSTLALGIHSIAPEPSPDSVLLWNLGQRGGRDASLRLSAPGQVTRRGTQCRRARFPICH